MSWTPLIDTDSGNLSAYEKQRELDEMKFRQRVLESVDLVNLNLRLLNARVESAFSTTITIEDVESP